MYVVWYVLIVALPDGRDDGSALRVLSVAAVVALGYAVIALVRHYNTQRDTNGGSTSRIFSRSCMYGMSTQSTYIHTCIPVASATIASPGAVDLSELF